MPIYSASISVNVLVKNFRPQKNVLILTAAIICYCCSIAVNAQEAEQPAEQQLEQPATVTPTPTPQPPLINAQPKPSYEPATIDSTAVDKTEQATKQAIEKTVDPTPQPPLIDAQQEPSYKPATIDSTAVEKTEQTTEQAIEQTVDPTPQPPLIDAQQEPSYEPATIDSTAVEKTEQATEQAIEQTVDPAPQSPLIDAQPEPGDGPVSDADATTEQHIDSTTQQTSVQPDNAGEADIKEPHQEALDESGKTTDWADLRPYQVNADWVQLKSGEWLRGRIIAMQDYRLEFYSDELKKLTIKWRNVKYIKSSEPYRLRFEDQTKTVGAIEITPEKVHVTTDYDDQTFDRGELLTIASGKETELSLWSYNITISLNLRRGNTDQTDFTAKINTKRQTEFSRVTLDYLGNFTEVRETETINDHRLNAAYNVFFGRHVFLSPVVAEVYRDPFQNIDHRVYVGTGAGYWLIKNIYTEWDIGGGPAYQSTTFDSVQPGQPLDDSTFTLVLSTRFNSKLNSKVDLIGSYIATLGDESTGNYSHHSIFTVKNELIDEFYLDVSFAWDRTRRPVENADGKTPEQDDFKILVGLRYDY